VGTSSWKILFVIDSERLSAEEATNRILEHFKSKERKRVRVAVVQPMHEAWLCIGLGGDRSKCRNDPIYELSKLLNKQYEKPFLAKYIDNINAERLRAEEDFKAYLVQLEWLYD